MGQESLAGWIVRSRRLDPEKGSRRGGRSEWRDILGQIGSPFEGIESGQEWREPARLGQIIPIFHLLTGQIPVRAG
ncbi:MAG: hypothetical protein RLZZ253_3102 [Verrucomicrobiota bacterium]